MCLCTGINIGHWSGSFTCMLVDVLRCWLPEKNKWLKDYKMREVLPKVELIIDRFHLIQTIGLKTCILYFQTAFKVYKIVRKTFVLLFIVTSRWSAITKWSSQKLCFFVDNAIDCFIINHSVSSEDFSFHFQIVTPWSIVNHTIWTQTVWNLN